jgi:hypothetical protein
MPQFGWTYLGKKGRQYKVGLYHGNRSGNLLIHCNARIMVVDFQVKESKSYSFFLDEELCKIELERRGDRMFYHFVIDKVTDTPRNRLRKKQDRRHLLQTLAFFGAILLLALLTYFIMKGVQKRAAESRITELIVGENAIQDVAVLDSILDIRKGAISYTFQVNGIPLERKLDRSRVYRVWGELVRVGDSFRFVREKAPPYPGRIRWEQPAEEQIVRFKSRVLEKERSLKPNLDAARFSCFLDQLVAREGPQVLPFLYHRDVSRRENPYFNYPLFESRIDSFLAAVSPECRPNF